MGKNFLPIETTQEAWTPEPVVKVLRRSSARSYKQFFSQNRGLKGK